MSWTNIRRVFLGALLFSLAGATGTATGCKGGVPSGSVSKAANNVQPGGGGGGGGGGPTAPTGTSLRLVAFESGLVFEATAPTIAPIGAAGEIWCFVTTNSGAATTGPAIGQPVIKINNVVETPVSAGPIGTTAATGASWLLILQPAAGVVSGQTIVASSGSINSNTVTEVVGPYNAANVADTATGVFPITSPIDAFSTNPAYQMQPPAAVFTFAHTGAVSVTNYFALTLFLDTTAGNLSIDNANEVLAPGSFTAGSNTGVQRGYVNSVLQAQNVPAAPPQPAIFYAFQVIPLNASGWGVGTSIDANVIQWVWFGVQ